MNRGKRSVRRKKSRRRILRRPERPRDSRRSKRRRGLKKAERLWRSHSSIRMRQLPEMLITLS